MADQLALLPGYLTAHLQLSLVALLVGTMVSVPLGVWIARRRRYEAGVLGAASVIQTIPSLALLAIMVPVMALLGRFTQETIGLELRGIGFAPAITALCLYSLLPILRNTVTGILGVEPSLVEAARAVGMTSSQRLWRVELPLAMPVIVAGLRTSAVWVVGTATLSTPVGATSLGNFIFTGLQTRNYDAVMMGCIAAAGLALLLDNLIRALEVGTRERRRGLVIAGLVALIGLYAFTATSFVRERLAETTRPLTIGSKAFTEQYILSEILAQRVTGETGVPTRAVQSLGSTVAYDALRSGDLDAYVDYSGTIWATIMKRQALPGDRAAVLDEVERYLMEEDGITLVAALGFENTYALGMREAHAAELGIETISDLARRARTLEIGGDYEFFQRNEWKQLVERYGLAFRRERSMDPALMYQAVARGEVDVISAFSTDGRIAAYDLALIRDDRGVIPPYDAIVLLGSRVPRELPQVAEALADLAGSVDAATMRRMNLAVDRDGRVPADEARDFLAGLPRR